MHTGTVHFPMTEQIADTIATHGALWACWHYTANRRGPRLSEAEWRILSRQRIAPASLRPAQLPRVHHV